MQPHTDRLLRAFLALEDPEEVHHFLTDMLTPKEWKRLRKRWRALELLAEDPSRTQTDVAETCKLSRVTVGRAAQVLNEGSGMAKSVLERLNADEDR